MTEGTARQPAWDDALARKTLRALFDAAVAAADPREVLAAHLPDKPAGRCIVVGAGKSAAVMAAALEDAWPDVAADRHRGDTLRPRRADAAHRGDRSLPPGARRQQRGAAPDACWSACGASGRTIWCWR